MTKVCTAAQAADLIRDRQTVASVGVIGWITPDAVLRAIADRFRKTGSPRDLHFFFPCGTGDSIGIGGMDQVAIEGLMKRIVSGSYVNPLNPATGERPKLMRLIRENRIEAYSWPIGATMHWLREVARRGPGYLTEVGLGTYIDPRQQGGKLTTRANDDLVRVIAIDGREYLHYPTWPIDVAIIRASTADAFGNLSFEDEPIVASSIALALAVKACGGTVIAQVRNLAERRTRPAQMVRIPGDVVDHIVLVPDQMMTTDTRFDARFLGGKPFSADGLPKLPPGPDKVMARRVAREIRPGVMSIFGFGASSDAPLALAESGAFANGGIDAYRFTTEHGPFGGIVMSGWQFSANLYPEALLDGVTHFDYIDGGNCKFAALAFAQVDRDGNINVSRFGANNPGAGGFIDIAHNARELVFAGTFTTAGLKTELIASSLKIVKEGSARKFVDQVEQITYPARKGVRERGQKASIITERAVFRVAPEGLELTEVAAGLDVRRDVLDQMAFRPTRIADPLPTMAADLFAP